MSATDVSSASDACARLTLQAIPPLMRVIREEVRSRRREGLSVPQFRALVCAYFHPDETLSTMAEFIGLSLPAASRMVDLLVRRGLLARRERRDDRRRIGLRLTSRGRSAFHACDQAAQTALARRFKLLSDADLRAIAGSLTLIINTFKTPGSQDGNGEKCGEL